MSDNMKFITGLAMMAVSSVSLAWLFVYQLSL